MYGGCVPLLVETTEAARPWRQTWREEIPPPGARKIMRTLNTSLLLLHHARFCGLTAGFTAHQRVGAVGARERYGLRLPRIER